MRLRCLQLADFLDEKAQLVTDKTPQLTEDLQSKAEHHAGKISEKARPMADQASSTIEGGAKRVAEGTPLDSACTALLVLTRLGKM